MDTAPIKRRRRRKVKPSDGFVHLGQAYGAWLRSMREAAGYTRYELVRVAHKRGLHMHVTTIQAAENSSHTPRIDTLLRMCALFDVDPGEALQDILKLMEALNEGTPSSIAPEDFVL